jgi:hypothetical protein
LHNFHLSLYRFVEIVLSFRLNVSLFGQTPQTHDDIADAVSRCRSVRPFAPDVFVNSSGYESVIAHAETNATR